MSDGENQDTHPTEEAVAGAAAVDDTPAIDAGTTTDDASVIAAAEIAAEQEPEPAAAEPVAGPEPEAAETEPDAADATDKAAPEGEAPAADADAPHKAEKRGRPRAKLEALEVGTEHKGKVVGLAKFGAFVDIGAVTDGLVHVTELSQKRVRNVEDAVAMGDEVDVWIKDVDLQSGRVSLSMRRRPSRPLAELKSGDVLSGTVTSTTKYGVFVDIGSETEGLVHISEMSSGFVERPSDVAGSGDAVEVRVKEIDAARERISLSMIGLANDVGLEAAAEQMAVDQYASGDLGSDEPEERMPTVVELALRRALGEMQDEADATPESGVEGAADGVAPDAAEEEAPAAAADNEDVASGTEPDDDSLGEMYERMIAAYKAEKSQHG